LQLAFARSLDYDSASHLHPQEIGSMFTRHLLAAFAACSLLAAAQASASDFSSLNLDAENALQKLYRTQPVAETMAQHAKAILVFPNIVRAGFVFGGSYGEGVLFTQDNDSQYYNSLSGSWGLQAGVQAYGYALFLMSDRAIEYLDKSDGWELGVGPTIVLVDAGVAKNLTTTTLNEDVYAFTFDQTGLMAGLAIEGSKISQMDHP
jgi:lipid-binding SYLF domain-containing protein